MKLAGEKRCRLAVHFDQRSALLILAALLRRSLARPRYRDAGLLGDGPHRLGELAFVHLHDEFEDVTAVVASEAVVHLLYRMDAKRRRFFLMEGAQAAEVLTGLFQTNIFADDADDVRLLLYLFRE
jgi:hypothetical protein